MPNIKVYGIVKNPNIKKQRIAWKKLFKEIQKLFKNESYAKEIVVTCVISAVHDLKENEQPYIQLELDCMNTYSEKIEKLKTLGMDIQVVKLLEFIPKS